MKHSNFWLQSGVTVVIATGVAYVASYCLLVERGPPEPMVKVTTGKGSSSLTLVKGQATPRYPAIDGVDLAPFYAPLHSFDRRLRFDYWIRNEPVNFVWHGIVFEEELKDDSSVRSSRFSK